MGDRIEELTERLSAHKTGELASLTTYLGRRLGIYEAMRGRDRVSAETVAGATGLHPRWVLEWLRQQTAAGIVDYVDEESFRLAPETATLLLDREGTTYLGWLFYRPLGGPAVDRLVDAFRTGVGQTWEDHGLEGAHLVADSTLAEHRRLVANILPLLDDAVGRLEGGCAALDVGCGSGVAITELARAFPSTSWLGIDPSPTAVAEARTRVKEAGLRNVELRVASAEELDESGRFDFAMELDCLHDMTHPDDAVAAIRRALRDDGIWLAKEPRSADTLRENLENPMAALCYGISIEFCMSSSLSTPDGAGLGTLGLSPERLRAMAERAGFHRFRTLDYEEDLLNAYYEIRP